MKFFVAVFITFSFALLSSCIDDSFTDVPPNLHSNINIDMNDDGFSNFVIIYSETPSFGHNVERYAKILPTNNLISEKILDHQNKPTLFLDNKDEIKLNVTHPLLWTQAFSGFEIKLVSIKKEHQGWPLQWNIHSNQHRDTHLLGVLFQDTDLQLKPGFIEFQFSYDTGIIEVVDKGSL